METRPPHYLLRTETSSSSQDGDWKFVLEAADGSEKLEAVDSEPLVRGERLELLTVVRALEALDQPSRVTLAATSRYINCGIAFGLDEWRASGWTWEHFGRMVPVKDADLWQRLDRALSIHQIDCRRWRFDRSHGTPRPALADLVERRVRVADSFAPRHHRTREGRVRHLSLVVSWVTAWWRWFEQLGGSHLPRRATALEHTA